MKIFHIIVGLEKGGAEMMLQRLVLNMPQHIHIIVSLTTVGSLGEELKNSGYNVYALDMRWFSIIGNIRCLWVLIRKYSPDVIQTWMYHADLLGGLLGRFAGIRNIVWNIRNTEIPQSKLSPTGVLIRVCASLSHVVPRWIVCCADSARYHHAALGYCNDRMSVIPNGYDTKRWRPPPQTKEHIRSIFDLPLDAFIVGIVGRFDPLKGHDLFIEAVSLIPDLTSQKCLFLMVGRGLDNNNHKITSIISTKGGRANFKLIGETRDVASIMYTLDLLCLTSKSEGFPNVVAEAMLMEVPCIVTNVGDAAKIVGNSGTVVLSRDPLELANAILSFINLSKAQIKEMGLVARQRIMKSYDITYIARRYEALYEWKDSK